MPSTRGERLRCAGCGEPIGVYEPLWRIGPRVGAEPTSWWQLRQQPVTGAESLWHATCAEAEGVDGG